MPESNRDLDLVEKFFLATCVGPLGKLQCNTCPVNRIERPINVSKRPGRNAPENPVLAN